MSKAKIPLKIGETLAENLITVLLPWCERIEVAGSIRRKKPEVGDIEIVAIPKMGVDLFGDCDPKQDHLAARLMVMIRDGAISKLPEINPEKTRPAWGQKYKKFFVTLNDTLGEMQVDLFCCDAKNWGNMFTIRTGSSEFSAALIERIKNQTPYRQQDGYLVDTTRGTVLEVASEQDYFKLAGVGWVNPENRTGRDAVRPIPVVTKVNRVVPPKKKAGVIKAITIHQPWASLIAAGFKEYETRSWETGYRGLIAIHAGKSKPKLTYADFESLGPDELSQLPDPMPLGAVVAVARMVDCTLTSQLLDEDKISGRETEMGNFARGRFGWKLEIMKVFDDPIPARGQQGLWEWDGWDGVIDETPPPVPLPAGGEGELAKPTGNVASRPRVIHNKTGPFDSGLLDKYIGRPGKWGNPFYIGRDGDRATVIKKYARYLRANPKLIREAQKELRGRDLRCWCYPDTCHGDVLLAVANADVGEIWYTTDEDVRGGIRARLERGIGI